MGRGFDAVYVPVGEPGYGKVRLVGVLASRGRAVLFWRGERMRVPLAARLATAALVLSGAGLAAALKGLLAAGQGVVWRTVALMGTAGALARACWIAVRRRVRGRAVAP